ncbi:MAG: phosphatidate cytidylyltransferase [Flavobacteriales bacterium]
MSDILQRALTGAVFLVVMISAIMYGSLTCFWLFAAIVVVGNWEYYKLQKSMSNFKKIIGLLLTFVIFTAVCSEYIYAIPALYSAAIIAFISMACSVFISDRTNLSDWAHSVFGQVYVTMPFVMLYVLAVSNYYYEYQIILSFFILLWLSDTGAYLVGKYFGSHKMIPKVSPKKTWEGLAGGVGFALLGAFALQFFNFQMIPLPWFVLALLVSLLGAVGDLFESQLKRNKGVKDSGNFMPGHGGILDRFDGVLLSVPVIFALVKLLA